MYAVSWIINVFNSIVLVIVDRPVDQKCMLYANIIIIAVLFPSYSRVQREQLGTS